jgi:hypothetical protein
MDAPASCNRDADRWNSLDMKTKNYKLDCDFINAVIEKATPGQTLVVFDKGASLTAISHAMAFVEQHDRDASHLIVNSRDAILAHSSSTAIEEEKDEMYVFSAKVIVTEDCPKGLMIVVSNEISLKKCLRLDPATSSIIRYES